VKVITSGVSAHVSSIIIKVVMRVAHEERKGHIGADEVCPGNVDEPPKLNFPRLRGATGTGVAWDAALRGFHVVLVEKRDLTHGTTGRYHGLLHSGGRYVVKDPQSAVECIAENRILRKTHTHCIEDTGGFFVSRRKMRPYPDQFKAACQKTGVPAKKSRYQKHANDNLNPRISRVFAVPDGSADSFLAAQVTAQAAQIAGAQILTYHEVVSLTVEGRQGNQRVVGARVRDVRHGQDVEIRADMTINASGAWAGLIAKTAGLEVNVIAGKGTMLAMNHRVCNTVLNRCSCLAMATPPCRFTPSLSSAPPTTRGRPRELTTEPWK
jgi:glycerol-3-phosphate dehydrogenase